jgi:putative transposase
MARKPRITQAGFYHVINRGVEKRDIYLNDKDRRRFLEIIDESAGIFDFSIHSYCLMKNHYHLLLKTRKENLSLIMKQINSKYSIYFNRKTKRVGHLWQGRFKSWYIHNEKYLVALIKYIELNPVKAQITKKTGEYRWAMSNRDENLECADFGLMDKIDFKPGMSDKETQNVEAVFDARLEVKKGSVDSKVKKSLSEHFDKAKREVAVANAIKDGYTQVEIGKYLGLSNIAVSKIFKIYRARECLFLKVRDMGVFWSYSKEISYDQAGPELFVEYLLKYGDFDDIKAGFELFGKRLMKKIWKARVVGSRQFLKLNVMLARVFFDMDVNGAYFINRKKNGRFEKLKALAS